jgi:glucan-binding YG repeat protein
MSFSRCLLLLSALLLTGLPTGGFAAERSHRMVTKAENSLRGTWYSAEGRVAFRSNGTVKFRGKRYYYAVSNGGMIQLSGNHSSNAIYYQLAGDQLSLTMDGKTMVYSRKRPGKK